MDSRIKLKEYESRMRAMERELRDKRISEICREGVERSRKNLEEWAREHEADDALRRAQERQSENCVPVLTEGEFAPAYALPASYPYDDLSLVQNADVQRLAMLQDELKRREAENIALQRQLREQYYVGVPLREPAPVPVPQPERQSAPAPQPAQQPAPQAAVPSAIYVTQNVTAPYNSAPYAASDPAPAKEPVTLQSGCETPPSTIAEPRAEGNGDEGKGIVYAERLTFAEAYSLLRKPQKSYCDRLKQYAKEVGGADEHEAKYHLTVGIGNKAVIKLEIKNGIVVCKYRIEEERLRQLRRLVGQDDVDIKVKETVLNVTDDASFEVAKQLIDLRVDQIGEDDAYRRRKR